MSENCINFIYFLTYLTMIVDIDIMKDKEKPMTETVEKNVMKDKDNPMKEACSSLFSLSMGKNSNVAIENPLKVKKRCLLEDPPSASSTDDEEDNEGEPSNPVQTPVSKKKTNHFAHVASVNVVEVVLVSDSSSDDEEIEDSGKNQTPSVPVTIPAANEGSDSGESDSEIKSVKPKKKRPSEEAEASAYVSLKRAKKELEPDTETKKAYFQRLWSEEDEIVILQGMIEFKSETGKNPTLEDMNGFYESMKKSISYEAKDLNQFINKIQSLKKKFVANMKKGDNLSFAKPHDETCFELSKLIWRANLESKKKIKVESLEPEDEDVKGNWFENSFLVNSFVSFGMDEELVKKKWSLVPTEVKKKIQEKLNLHERKFALEKIDLVHEVASVLP